MNTSRCKLKTYFFTVNTKLVRHINLLRYLCQSQGVETTSLLKLASLGSSASWLTSAVRLEHINLGIRQLQLTGMAPALSILQLTSSRSGGSSEAGMKGENQ